MDWNTNFSLQDLEPQTQLRHLVLNRRLETVLLELASSEPTLLLHNQHLDLVPSETQTRVQLVDLALQIRQEEACLESQHSVELPQRREQQEVDYLVPQEQRVGLAPTLELVDLELLPPILAQSQPPVLLTHHFLRSKRRTRLDR